MKFALPVFFFLIGTSLAHAACDGCEALQAVATEFKGLKADAAGEKRANELEKKAVNALKKLKTKNDRLSLEQATLVAEVLRANHAVRPSFTLIEGDLELFQVNEAILQKAIREFPPAERAKLSELLVVGIAQESEEDEVQPELDAAALEKLSHEPPIMVDPKD